MRTIRTLTAGLACAALLPAVVAAQQVPQKVRSFTDSWYWGAKGGVSMFGSAAEDISAPTFGGEWMITRTRVAMYVSVEQSFFDTQGAVYDPTSTGGARIVDIKDSRRYNLQLFAFPKQFGSLRPYAGLGFALIMIRDASPVGTFSSAGSQDSVFAAVDDRSSRTSPVFTLGTQFDFSRAALFVQGSTMATRNRFLINGKANTYLLEAGLRYNLVDAIEKLH
jgi:opacity protein-like surface antigen